MRWSLPVNVSPWAGSAQVEQPFEFEVREVFPIADEMLMRQGIAASKKTFGSDGDYPEWVQKIQENLEDVEAAYQMATFLHDYKGEKDYVQLARDLLGAFAEPPASDVKSQAFLGKSYYSSGNLNYALHYFVRAGRAGPDQESLYNAGKIFAEQEKWVTAIAYARSAATLSKTHPDKTDAALTQTAQEAYKQLVQTIAQRVQIELPTMPVMQTADLFIYGGPLEGYPEEHDKKDVDLWRESIFCLDDFNKTLTESNGQEKDTNSLESVVTHLEKLWKTSADKFSPLQGHLVLGHLNNALETLSEIKTEYFEKASEYTEKLKAFPSTYM